MDELTFAPGALIGTTGQYNIVGAGGLVDASAGPPWFGLSVGSSWRAPFTPPDLWSNESDEYRWVSLGVQLQGGGAFTAGVFYTHLRDEFGPSFLSLAAAAFGHTFTATPSIAGQGGASDFLVARPLIGLQVVKL
jgi:hypothetical protein